MRRQDIWRHEYAANRYLAGKSVAHITSRLRYLLETIVTLSPSGQIGVEADGKLARWLWARFTHTTYEFEMRGLGFPAGFLAGAHIPRVTHPRTAPEHDAYLKRKRTATGEIFKFGKKKWLNLALDEGSLRFASAVTYKDPSLNPAIQDDELSFTIYPTSSAPVGIIGIPSASSSGSITLTHLTDYYVQCFSTRYSLRMYEDFSADSCLIVYDAKEFGRRVIKLLRAVFPDWIIGSIPITYVDPDDPGNAPLPIPAAKHMKYAYQCEERIVCHPRTQVLEELHPVTIQAGSLRDIAEVVEL